MYLCVYTNRTSFAINQHLHPFFFSGAPGYYFNVTFPYSFLFGALPSWRNLSFSSAFLADYPSSAFFYIYYCLTNAFLASSVNAWATFVLSRAEVSIHGISDPDSFINYYAYSYETWRCVSPKSLLLPTTINGNESG